VSRRFSTYSGDSSDDSGISDGPNRFSNYFTKKRPAKSGGAIERRKVSFRGSTSSFGFTDQLSFLNYSLATSELDEALPLLAYLLEPVQRVMRYPLLLKNLTCVLLRSPLKYHAVLGTAENALSICEHLAMITNLTQPFQSLDSVSEGGDTDLKPKTKPQRRRFEFRRVVQRFLQKSR
jgi:hypothetical protein